jgi:hypothetical protein
MRKAKVRDDAQVLTTDEAAHLLSVHPATLRRLHQFRNPNAPPRLQISPGRVGYRRGDLLEWARKRLSPAPI